MTWQLYQLTYELHSPLHIGYHKIGNLQRTRYYVPARNVWGAVTEALTRRGFAANDAPQGDYAEIGKWVKAHCAFSYWFVCDDETLLNPRYVNGELKYGELRAAEFEQRYLGSHVTTALDAATTSVQDGSLHEVEFIAPYPRPKNEDKQVERTTLRGWVFLDATAQTVLGDESKWCESLGNLQIGGERRYGFGQVRLIGKLAHAEKLNGCAVELGETRPRVSLEKDCPLFAHTLTPGVEARGDIEPLVGRETQTSAQFGAQLTRAQICWTPGAQMLETQWLTVTTTGMWARED